MGFAVVADQLVLAYRNTGNALGAAWADRVRYPWALHGVECEIQQAGLALRAVGAVVVADDGQLHLSS